MEKGFFLLIVVTLTSGGIVFCQAKREPRLLPIFEIYKFQNGVCESENSGPIRFGTCYTADECKTRGGVNGGSCASGFGICCIVTLQTCGQSSSENQTYFVTPENINNGTQLCNFEICKVEQNICRIRLDFETFVISGPQAGTVSDYQSTSDNEIYAGAIGDCVLDTFTFSAPGSTGSPIICGYNTGQHMIVDASNDCHVLSFSFGAGGTANTRQWEIRGSQYECGNEAGGPPGCLQYFTGVSGTNVASFNFPTEEASVPSTATHLSQQEYTICFRQELNRCAICFSSAISDSVSEEMQASFGVSLSSDVTNLNNQLDEKCTEDYLAISNAEAGETLQIGKYTVGFQRICGRAFNALSDSSLGKSVCTQTTPFRLTFVSDENEVTDGDDAATNEQDLFPGGIIGFNLVFQQISC